MAEFSPGLEGVVAAETEISEVDGQGGRLILRGGYPLQDPAAPPSHEEIAYLLLHGKLPDRDELERFRNALEQGRQLTEPARKTLDAAPVDTDPMDVLK